MNRDFYTSRVTGLLTAATALWVVNAARPVSVEMWVGALSLAIAGEIVHQVPKLRLAGPLLALPGAILIGRMGGLPGAGLEGNWPDWIPTFTIAAIAFCAPLVGEMDRARRTREITLSLLGISAFAAFLCVPDTEEIGQVAAICLFVGVLAWFHRGMVLGPGGAWATTGVLLWTIAMGGRGREGSIIGATFCLGMLLAEPIGRWISGRRHAHLPAGVAGRRFFLIAHFGLAFFMARVAGMRGTPRQALELAAPAMIAAVAMVIALERMAPHRDRVKSAMAKTLDPGEVAKKRSKGRSSKTGQVDFPEGESDGESVSEDRSSGPTSLD